MKHMFAFILISDTNLKKIVEATTRRIACNMELIKETGTLFFIVWLLWQLQPLGRVVAVVIDRHVVTVTFIASFRLTPFNLIPLFPYSMVTVKSSNQRLIFVITDYSNDTFSYFLRIPLHMDTGTSRDCRFWE